MLLLYAFGLKKLSHVKSFAIKKFRLQRYFKINKSSLLFVFNFPVALKYFSEKI